MRNRYEFNIEDIMIASVKDNKNESGYTFMFVRDLSDPDKNFIERYEAVEQVNEETGAVDRICERCGTWSTFNIEDKITEMECPNCEEDYRNVVSEEYVIEQILSWFDKDIFYDCDITINGQEIK